MGRERKGRKEGWGGQPDRRRSWGFMAGQLKDGRE